MTHSPQAGLRKAAILIAALDRESADDVLQRMDPEQARQIRARVIELGPVNSEEERRVIEEFLRLGPMIPRGEPSGVELDKGLARRLAERSSQIAKSAHLANEPENVQRFRFLHQTECEEVARLLANERPQTIALVLAHLPAEQAGSVLALLPSTTQVDVVRRLVDLEEADAEVLQEVERGLQSRLTQHVPMRRRRATGVSTVRGMLEASQQSVGRRILDNLERHDRRLAEQFMPPASEIDSVTFADLVELDRMSLAVLVEAADPALLALALVGAAPTTMDRFLRPLAADRARAIRAELDNPPPTRLSDVEAAQSQLAQLAHDLAIEGRIHLQPTRHLPRMAA